MLGGLAHDEGRNIRLVTIVGHEWYAVLTFVLPSHASLICFFVAFSHFDTLDDLLGIVAKNWLELFGDHELILPRGVAWLRGAQYEVLGFCIIGIRSWRSLLKVGEFLLILRNKSGRVFL